MTKTKINKGEGVFIVGGEGYDDCPICQAIKKAEKEKRGLHLEELEKSFADAKKKGGIVVKQPKEEPKKVN
ncbi:hypothetical protein HZC27_02420 [Candidatus Roizmanbacteria bacterium]|nr:hypothetical protein [Candidatus Roizmanbacteria bacterium]